MTIRETLERYGYTTKAVRAWCAERRWRYIRQGAPLELYAARRA